MFLAALLTLLAAYVIGYEARVPIAWESDYTMTVGVFVLLLFETCIRSGIIPVNSQYAKLFALSPLSMQINDKQGAAVLRSEYAEANDKALYAESFSHKEFPFHYDKNTVIFSNEIAGGSVYWKEDIEALNRLQEEITDSITKLTAANAVLVKEEAIKRSMSEAAARTQLMERLENEMSKHILRLDHMMERLGGAEDKKEAIARITLMLCYIKRRCGLFFRAGESVAFNAHELTLYVDEFSEIAGFAGVRIIFTCEPSVRVPARLVTILCDLFYSALDWAVQMAHTHILVDLGREGGSVILRILTPSGRSFQPDKSIRDAILSENGSLIIKEVDDDAVGISLSFPEGGKRDG